MTRDRVYAEELAHDSGVKLTKHDLEEALDDLIDRILTGKKVGRFGLDAFVEQFSEYIAGIVIVARSEGRTTRAGAIEDLLETLIRRELEDSDAVRERAAELVQEVE